MKKVQWQISLPIFRNSIILKQLGLTIGIPFGIVVLVISLASGRSVYTLYGLGLIAFLFLLTWAFIMLVYGGKYEAEFILDDMGVLCRTAARQRKKNAIVNGLAIILSFLSRTFVAAGAGLMAQSRQEVFIPWRRVRRAKYNERARTILIRGGLTENIALFCTEENYSQVEDIIRSKMIKG